MNAKRWYETTFIVNAGLEDHAVDGVVNKVVEYIKNNGGEISTVDKWGRKRLAYPINKKNNGYYVYVIFESAATLPPLLERYFFLDDNVIRQLTVELDLKMLEYRRATQAQREAEVGQPDPVTGDGKNNEEKRKTVREKVPVKMKAKRVKKEPTETAEAPTEAAAAEVVADEKPTAESPAGDNASGESEKTESGS